MSNFRFLQDEGAKCARKGEQRFVKKADAHPNLKEDQLRGCTVICARALIGIGLGLIGTTAVLAQVATGMPAAKDKASRIDDLRSAWRCSLHMDLDSLAKTITERVHGHGITRAAQAHAYEDLTALYLRKNHWIPALNAADSALQAYGELDDPQGIARVELSKGEVLMRAGDVTGASEALESSLDGLAQTNDHFDLGEVHRLLGRIHYLQQQFTASLKHYHRALAEFRMCHDNVGISQTYTAIAVASIESNLLGDRYYEVGMAYYDSALTAAHSVACERQLASTLNNMALIHIYDRNELGRARSYLDSALNYARLSGDSLLFYNILHSDGVYLVHSKKYGEAIRTCERVLGYANRSGVALLQRDATEVISTALRNEGRWREAFNEQAAYYRLRDSSYNMSSREAILERSLKRENERRRYADSLATAQQVMEAKTEATLAELRSERASERFWLAVVVTVLVLAGGTAFYRNDRKRRAEKAKRTAAQLEIKALRAQMNPHFLFNVLNSIHDHLEENDRQASAEHVVRFGKLVREVLECSRTEEIPLRRELDVLRSYIELERMRLPGRFEVSVVVGPDVDPEVAMVPPMVLQPFVENAIWHGLSPKKGLGHLLIEVRGGNGALHVVIEDDGVGRPAGTDAGRGINKGSLGTTITRSRLEMLAKEYGRPAGFTYPPIKQGTRVEIVLPLVD